MERVRVFAKTKDINLACMLQGSFPQKADEIAIDRMHADNVGIKVGDETVTVSGENYIRLWDCLRMSITPPYTKRPQI